MNLAQLLLERLRASAPSRLVVVSSMAHRYAYGLRAGDFAKEEVLSPVRFSPIF